MKNFTEILGAARERGLQRGISDREQGYQNDAPLSGEWAGESIPELLGDLFGAAVAVGELDCWEIEAEICDSYEQGYRDAFADRESVETV